MVKSSKIGILTSKINICGIVVASIALVPQLTYAELYFDLSGLNLSEESKKQLNLSELERVDTQISGVYKVSVIVNSHDMNSYDLNFVNCGEKLCAELPVSLLKKWGIQLSGLPKLKDLKLDEKIVNISNYIPNASENFNFSKKMLQITVPQAAIDQKAKGYISPDRWDDGVPAFFTSYSASGYEYNNTIAGNHISSQYLNLRSGLNIVPWRLRNYSYYSHNNNDSNRWNFLQTWLERDIKSLRSRLVIGETSTPAVIFDSFNFSGAYIASQDQMLPDSMRGYAPEIRGVAMTNATVEIRKDGNLLYQTFVTPGEFVINDLYATSTTGDLEVIIREQDGTVRSFVQSYASPPISVRKGALKYSTTAGIYGNHNSVSDVKKQKFVQSEFLYGLWDSTSIYGGLTYSEYYHAGVIGFGQGIAWLGAFSLDLTHAETEFSSGNTKSGQAIQLRYSKSLDLTNTTLSLINRYYTNHYFDFSDASNGYFYEKNADNSAVKNSVQLSVSQNMSDWGYFSLSANQKTYWDTKLKNSLSFTGSWSKSFNGVNVSLSQSQSKNWSTGRTDNITCKN